MKLTVVVALASSIAIALAACGSDDASSTSSTSSGGSSGSTSSGGSSSGGSSGSNADGGGSSSGTTSDSGPSAQCSDVAQEGAFITETQMNGSAPAPAGGTIVPGKYVLTAMERYVTSGAGFAPRADTMLLTANTFELVMTIQSTGNVYRSKSTYTTNGNEITGTAVCVYPALDSGLPSTPLTGHYTATANEYRSYSVNDAYVFVYTKKN